MYHESTRCMSIYFILANMIKLKKIVLFLKILTLTLKDSFAGTFHCKFNTKDH